MELNIIMIHKKIINIAIYLTFIFSVLFQLLKYGIDISNIVIVKDILNKNNIQYDKLFLKYDNILSIHAYGVKYNSIFCDKVSFTISKDQKLLKMKHATINLKLSNTNIPNKLTQDILIESANIKIERNGTIYYMYNVRIDIQNNIIRMYDAASQELILQYHNNNCIIGKKLSNNLPFIMYEIEGYLNNINDKCNGKLKVKNSKISTYINVKDNKIEMKYNDRMIKGKLIHKDNKAQKIIIYNIGLIDTNIWPDMYKKEEKLFNKYIASLKLEDASIDIENFQIDCDYTMSVKNNLLNINNVIGHFNMQHGLKKSTFQWEKIKGYFLLEKTFYLEADGKLNIKNIKNLDKYCTVKHSDIDADMKIRNESIIIDILLNKLTCKSHDILCTFNGKVSYFDHQYQGKVYGNINGADTIINLYNNNINIRIDDYKYPAFSNNDIDIVYEGKYTDHLAGLITINDSDKNISIHHDNLDLRIDSDIISGKISLSEKMKIIKCKLKYLNTLDVIVKNKKIIIKGNIPISKNKMEPIKIGQLISPLSEEKYDLFIDIDYNKRKLNGTGIVNAKKYLSIDALNCSGTFGYIKKITDQYHIHINDLSMLESIFSSGEAKIILSIYNDYISGNIRCTKLYINNQSQSDIKSLLYKTLLLFVSPKFLFQSVLSKKISIPSTEIDFTYKYPTIQLHKMNIKDIFKSINVQGSINLSNKDINFDGYISPMYILNQTIKQMPIFNLFGNRDTLLNKNIYITGKIDEPSIQFFKKKILSK